MGVKPRLHALAAPRTDPVLADVYFDTGWLVKNVLTTAP